MTSTATSYQPSLSAAVAREHVNDLVRAAHAYRVATCLPDGNGTRTFRRRPLWWLGIAMHSATPRTA
jgi:hypothetical protein